MSSRNRGKPLTWQAVSDVFAPFAGACLYAIRADAFFHLAHAGSARLKFVVKNQLYPAFSFLRAARAHHDLNTGLVAERFLLVCDYAAEPGFGTLRPILQKWGGASVFAGLDSVIRN